MYLERKDRYNRGHELTFRSIDKNVLNFSMIGPNVFGFNKNYEVDLGHSNSLILFDKNSNKAGYKIEFKNLSSNEVGYRIKPFTKNDLVKYEKEKFLYLLLDRCIDTYGFDTVENIKQCVQQEVFNEKQLAILREQNEILKEQNRIAQDRLDNINNYSSQFLNAFRRGITMSLISNAMQNRNSRTTIIYNNYQEPR